MNEIVDYDFKEINMAIKNIQFALSELARNIMTVIDGIVEGVEKAVNSTGDEKIIKAFKLWLKYRNVEYLLFIGRCLENKFKKPPDSVC